MERNRKVAIPLLGFWGLLLLVLAAPGVARGAEFSALMMVKDDDGMESVKGHQVGGGEAGRAAHPPEGIFRRLLQRPAKRIVGASRSDLRGLRTPDCVVGLARAERIVYRALHRDQIRHLDDGLSGDGLGASELSLDEGQHRLWEDQFRRVGHHMEDAAEPLALGLRQRDHERLEVRNRALGCRHQESLPEPRTTRIFAKEYETTDEHG